MKKIPQEGQTVIEYLLLLSLVALVVLLGFTTYLPRSQELSSAFFNKAANYIMDEQPAMGARGGAFNYP